MYIRPSIYFETILLKRDLYICKRKHEKLAYGETKYKSSFPDYVEYIKDPASYFLRKEHWSLDGA